MNKRKKRLVAISTVPRTEQTAETLFVLREDGEIFYFIWGDGKNQWRRMTPPVPDDEGDDE